MSAAHVCSTGPQHRSAAQVRSTGPQHMSAAQVRSTGPQPHCRNSLRDSDQLLGNIPTIGVVPAPCSNYWATSAGVRQEVWRSLDSGSPDLGVP